jgi:hypothetical protein
MIFRLNERGYYALLLRNTRKTVAVSRSPPEA